MAAYVVTWQDSKDPKDKTGGEIYVRSHDDDDAIVHANERLLEAGKNKHNAFYVHLKQCGGRTVYYNRGF